jgi:transposase-like protein
MSYLRFKGVQFFKQINTEEKARNLVWTSRFGSKEFVCPECSHEGYYQLVCRPEIRKCKSCGHLARLRVGTIFENTKTPMLKWVRAIYMMMQDKRGVSALELKRRLEFGSYETALVITRKIRRALQCRDERYKLKEIIELDGTGFGNAAKNNQRRVLVAIETKA